MRQHTHFTYSVLDTIGGLDHIAKWAAFHHENLDGTGYPFYLGAEKLNTGARILKVADTFTAPAENRPYRPAVERKQIVDILMSMARNKALDPYTTSLLEMQFHNRFFNLKNTNN